MLEKSHRGEIVLIGFFLFSILGFYAGMWFGTKEVLPTHKRYCLAVGINLGKEIYEYLVNESIFNPRELFKEKKVYVSSEGVFINDKEIKELNIITYGYEKCLN